MQYNLKLAYATNILTLVSQIGINELGKLACGTDDNDCSAVAGWVFGSLLVSMLTIFYGLHRCGRDCDTEKPSDKAEVIRIKQKGKRVGQEMQVVFICAILTVPLYQCGYFLFGLSGNSRILSGAGSALLTMLGITLFGSNCCAKTSDQPAANIAQDHQPPVQNMA